MITTKKIMLVTLFTFSVASLTPLYAKCNSKKKHECRSVWKFAAGFAAGALTLHALQAKVGYTKTDVMKFCIYKQLNNLFRKITQ